MLAEVGSLLVGLALAAALGAAGAVSVGLRTRDARWTEIAHSAVLACAAFLGLALAALLAAFLGDRFSLRYVAEHSSQLLPVYLKVSAVWAGQEGSLLLWSSLQALFAALVVSRRPGTDLDAWAVLVLSLVTAFFAGVTLFLSNPFVRLPAAPADGQGLSPLLRHPGMIFHPPALYLGYVGLSVPFAFALAAMVTGKFGEWAGVARRWTLAAWLLLGLGLLLGARWAYDVLGWGGYWAWDPVENAGLMPWLTATALLHGVVMQQEQRRKPAHLSVLPEEEPQATGFAAGNLLLAVLSFVLVLFGTFATRSGLIQSVHAFARSNLGPVFLAAIGLVLLTASALALRLRRRRRAGGAPAQPEPEGAGLLSRQGAFFLTLLLLSTLTASVFVGSVLPTLTQVLLGRSFEAGPAWFDRVTGPQFAALVLLIGVCPLLGRSASALRRLGRRGWTALLGAALVAAAAALAGFTRPLSLAAFAVVGLAGAVTADEIARGTIDSVRRGDGAPPRAIWRALGRLQRRYGGYLVHAGVVLMALGVIGTRAYASEVDLVLGAGEPVQVEGYTLVFDSLRQEPVGDHLVTEAEISVYRRGEYLTRLQPRLNQYAGFGEYTSVPAVRSTAREDLYATLAGWAADGSTVTLSVTVNPLIGFLWLGGLVLLAGGSVAFWPPAGSQSIGERRFA